MGRTSGGSGGGGGAPGTTVESYITENLAVTGDTITNVTSVALAKGTWLVVARVLWESGVGTVVLGAWLGPTSGSLTGAVAASTSEQGVAGSYSSLVIAKSVVLAADATLYLICYATGAVTVQYEDPESDVGAVSGMTAVQTA